MGKAIRHFLLVDDDAINNVLTKMILKKSFGEVQINAFTVPEEGLEFMKSEPINNPPVILLLDINMPTISGWEYLDAFELFDPTIKMKYEIYILSSSVDPKDINRAKENPLVKDFIEKPINNEILRKMFV